MMRNIKAKLDKDLADLKGELEEKDDRLKNESQRVNELKTRVSMTTQNAADIKLAVDAIELAFERDYITTYVIGTGDSDFTPLVHKLRELDKRVIGIGVGGSTSGLLPPACDEFLFYESLGFRQEGEFLSRIRNIDGSLESDIPMAWTRS